MKSLVKFQFRRLVVDGRVHFYLEKLRVYQIYDHFFPHSPNKISKISSTYIFSVHSRDLLALKITY
jgi:hypothetical protein